MRIARRRHPLWSVLALLLAPSCSLAAAPLLEVAAGYRVDRFDWSIAGAHRNPDILSELRWDDLEIAQLSLAGEFGPWGPLGLRTDARYGYAGSGSVQDSDYAASGRRDEFSRSHNRADGSRFIDLSIAAGFPRERAAGDWRTQLTPLVGLSFHRQDLRLSNGRQVLSIPALTPFPPPAVGPFAGLDSRYAANWAGPWLGLELRSRARRGFGLLLRIDYHFWAAYWAEADWNLRSDLSHPVSFRHRADGRGLALALGLSYAPAGDSPWSWHLRAGWQRWRTWAGEDRVYLADGSKRDGRFNGADWNSREISLGGGYRF